MSEHRARKRSFKFHLTELEKHQLLTLAAARDMTPSQLLLELIRDAANHKETRPQALDQWRAARRVERDRRRRIERNTFLDIVGDRYERSHSG